MILKAFFSSYFWSPTFRKPAQIRISNLQRTYDTKNMKKGDFQNYPRYSFYEILKIPLRSRYRAPDPNLANNRIRTLVADADPALLPSLPGVRPARLQIRGPWAHDLPGLQHAGLAHLLYCTHQLDLPHR